MPRTLAATVLAATALAGLAPAAHATRIDVKIEGEATERWTSSRVERALCSRHIDEQGVNRYRFATPGRQRMSYGESGFRDYASMRVRLDRRLDRTITRELSRPGPVYCPGEPKRVDTSACAAPIAYPARLGLRANPNELGFAFSATLDAPEPPERCGGLDSRRLNRQLLRGPRFRWYDRLVGNPWRNVKPRRKVVKSFTTHAERRTSTSTYSVDARWTMTMWIVGRR